MINVNGSNTYILSNGYYLHELYNMLPYMDNLGLDGHYTLLWKDSDIKIFKHANYGGLTYVNNSDNENFLKLTKHQYKKLRLICRYILYGKYLYGDVRAKYTSQMIFDYEHYPEKQTYLINKLNNTL